MPQDYRQGQAVPAAVGPINLEVVGGFAQPAQNLAYPTLNVAADLNAPAAHTAAVITYAAVANFSHVISGIYVSLAGSGTIGTAGVNLGVVDGSTTVFSVDVTAQGLTYIPFLPPRAFMPGNALVITLADPGANITGKLNANHWTVPGLFVGSGYSLDFSQAYNSMYL